MVAGKPLIAWTLEEAKKCTTLDKYVVSTDDDEIASVVAEYGVETYKEHYSDGTNPLLDRLVWLLLEMERSGETYDVLVDIRATNPLKLAEDIDGCVKKLLETGADVVAGVSLLDDHHPMRIKTMVAGDRLIDVWPEPLSGLRQDLQPPVYIRNGSVYACRVNALYEGIHNTGGDVRGYLMPPERGVNVDGKLDLALVDILLKAREQE
jgi:N-acylneuraminate cytidylyltransferase